MRDRVRGAHQDQIITVIPSLSLFEETPQPIPVLFARRRQHGNLVLVRDRDRARRLKPWFAIDLHRETFPGSTHSEKSAVNRRTMHRLTFAHLITTDEH